MPPSRAHLALAALVAGLALEVTGCGDPQPAASPAFPISDEVQRVDRQGLLPSTTTTTTAPPTTTTTAPPAPPPIATARRAAPAPPPPPPAPAPVPDPAGEARALQLVNGERAKAGLAPLQLSGGAGSVARGWSVHMAGAGLAHNPNLSGDLKRAGVTGWRTYGENVGYAGNVDQAHAMFMGSSGHRANILNAAFSQVGIGVVRSGGKVWVTMDFVGY